MSTPEWNNTAPEWKVDPVKLGDALAEALEEIQISQVEAARRIAPDVRTKNKVIGRWIAGDHLSEDQLSLLFSVMRESPVARDIILGRMGVEVPVHESEQDRELQRRVDLLRRAWRHEDRPAVRSLLSHLEVLLREIEGSEPSEAEEGPPPPKRPRPPPRGGAGGGAS